MKDLKIYKNSKEIPFLIYKRIEQTGDFLYMIKGYQEGDEIEDADPEELKEKFNALIQDFSMSAGEFTQEMHDYCNYNIATMEFNRLTAIVNALDVIISTTEKLQSAGIDCAEENETLISTLLEGIIVERNPDLLILKKNLLEKMAVQESNALKYREILELSAKENPQEEFDIDDQFLNVFMVLEQPIPDESKLTLYQYSLMVKKAVERSKQLEKMNK